MRRIVAFDRVSADGYFCGPDGQLDWVVPDPEIDKAAGADIEKAAADDRPGSGTILFGRRTYDMFESFWPKALDESSTSPDPHQAGRHAPELRAMAVFINEAEKIVFSRTRKEVTWKNSRLVRRFDPREIEDLKTQPGKDMLVFGSGTIVSLLTEHGLVDEYQFIVGPLLLGRGRSLVSGVPKSLRLELKQAKEYSSGNVMLRYTRSS